MWFVLTRPGETPEEGEMKQMTVEADEEERVGDEDRLDPLKSEYQSGGRTQ